jgi:hypothetical protein
MAMWAEGSTSSCSIGIAHDDDAGSLCLGLSASVAKRPAAAITDNKPTHTPVRPCPPTHALAHYLATRTLQPMLRHPRDV